MKQNGIILLIVLFISALTLLLYRNYDQVRLTELEQENQALSARNNQLEAELSYHNQFFTATLTDDFQHWHQIEQIAEQMVEDSYGQFKKTWALYLANEAKNYRLDPFLIYELLKVETGKTFDPELIGPETRYGRAYGMSQFMLNTAPWIAEIAGLPYNDELLFDPYYSIQLAVVYLDFLYHKYDNWDEALTAYHRGMTGMEQYKEENGHAKSEYAQQIQSQAKEHHHTIVMTY
ncbi:transglycosylase SLT domain-containing protein [Amphibacillus sediminis]|uniref:transglycosylase SLT domain-containing protein n=1 Tax=Amphibacillus sediminis TaxID=360185 RepID=UPI000833F196|nr:transglycosylase SLT domain-containing protein [Amphibacillus sediminis]